MIYPSMRGKQSARISIPLLSGGLNVSRQATEIFDNQLTECTNMWYHRGYLQTRAGVRYIGENLSGLKYTGHDVVLNDSKSGLDGELYSVWYSMINKSEISKTELQVYCISDKGNFFEFPINETTSQPFINYLFDFNINEETANIWFAPHTHKSTQYLYIYIYNGYDMKVAKLKFGRDYCSIDLVTDEEFEQAAPTVLVNNDFGNADFKPNGVTFEGYNIINGKYKVLCTTNGKSYESYFPFKQAIGVDIKIEFYTTLLGPITITIPMDKTKLLNGEYYYWKKEEARGEYNILAEYLNNWPCLRVRYKKFDEDTYHPIDKGSGSSNLTAYMTRELDNDLLMSIANTTKAIWFGGEAGGLAGGSYLFTFNNASNTLHWSDINSPLYFPEGNYANIGSSNEVISNMAKMNEVLVVLKPTSVYCMSYSSVENLSVDQLINGVITDVTAYSAVFPIVCIHDMIGCDLPNTVQLCRNRLVWVNSNGKAYEIVTHSYTSERNVYEISMNIENLLKTDSFLNSSEFEKSQVFATDWNGFYVMSFGGEDVYLMNYNNYGFTNIYSYSKTDDAQSYMEWYHWRFPNKVKELFSHGAKLILCIENEGKNKKLALMDDDLNKDVISEIEKLDIPCSFSTKWFDFGMMDYYKSIDQLYLTAGSEKGGDITLSYITQRGTVGERTINLEAETSDNENFIKTYRQLPMQKRLRHFGLKISSQGQFVFGGFVIKFKVMGGIK